MRIKVKKRKNSELVSNYRFILLIVTSLLVITVLTFNPSTLSNHKNEIDAMSSESVSKETSENIVGISEEEQKNIYDSNNENMEENLKSDIPYIYDDELGVAMPLTNWNTKMNAQEEEKALSQYALTYPDFGSPGKGNLIAFAHNSSLFPQGYFTPFVNNLKVGDVVVVKTKEKNYKYKITSRSLVKDTEVDDVFYESDEPIITIGTCDVPSATTNKRIIWTGTLIN